MKKSFIIIAIILFAGLLLRLINIDKPEGLWNDEYVSWAIASTPFGNGFWNAVKSQCHMPLYYLYLKFFRTIFGNSDLLLRITSLFAGILAIPVMYFLGREDCKETGFICAGFTAISSFLIYYSQEVRLYSLLFLISAVCMVYTLKIIKNPNKKNFILCALFNLLIILTHTIGFVFVFFNLLFISFFLFDKYKKAVMIIWCGIFTGTVLSCPLIIKIMTTQSFSQWWNHFSISKIGFLLTDYFSPVMTNLTGAPDNFFFMPKLLPFMLIPTILALICIVKSSYKNKINTGLLLVSFGFVSVLIIASICGKLVFVTKYTIEIYPILIFLACSCKFEKKYLKTLIIVIFSLISTGYLIFHPFSAYKIYRAEGHKIVADILENMDLKQDDWLIFEYYPKDRFDKYIDFSKYNIVSINKGNFPEYLSDNISYNDVYKNGKTLYKDLFLSDNNTYLGNKLQREVFDFVKPGQNVVMIVLNSVAFYTPDDVKRIANDESLYNRTPLLFLVFSYIKKETFYDIEKQLVPQRVERKGKWMLVKFTKVNN